MSKLVDDFTKDEIFHFFDYLDDLRSSGITNMFGATRFLTGAFGVSEREGSQILSAWMDTFDGKTVLAARVTRAFENL